MTTTTDQRQGNLARFEKAVEGLSNDQIRSITNHVFGWVAHSLPEAEWNQALESALRHYGPNGDFL